ncbi:thermonuclease family protein [Microbaculum sp. FT89]|uniref:thermonuclease family protein n=1 Tax=Microbaculum sp. FT89 TaxID=3447298 RepID=UPI003F537C6D
MRLAFVLLLLSATIASAADVVSGRASIIDGDTIEVAHATIRLYGIDAPEAGQKCDKASGGSWRCGDEATGAIADLAEGKDVRCEILGKDDYDRLLGICTVGGVEINQRMVADGHAWAFVKYASDYVDVEQQARSAGLGVWQGPARAPWDYRAEKWTVAEQEAPEGCPIKGNISRNGKIYHPPWSPWYSRTRIDESKGERWFCSEREAVDAGWRAPHWR